MENETIKQEIFQIRSVESKSILDLNTTTSQFFTVAEIMQITKLSRPTILRYRKKGQIPFVNIGSRVLIPAAFLERLKAQAEGSAQEGQGDDSKKVS